MPLDGAGNLRHNDEVARFHSKAAGKPHPGDEAEDGSHVEIHSHGDGTFHTMHNGEKVDHETHGHALIHAAKAHAEEGHKHFVAHHDGSAVHTHHHDGGEPEHEEHDPEDSEGTHGHLDRFLGTETPEEEDEEEPVAGHKGLDGMY